MPIEPKKCPKGFDLNNLKTILIFILKNKYLGVDGLIWYEVSAAFLVANLYYSATWGPETLLFK